MKKIVGFIKNIKYNELIKTLGLSVIIIYTILSIQNNINAIYSFKQLNELIKDNPEQFEETLKGIEEDITYLNVTDIKENNRNDKEAYYQMKYPNAMYMIYHDGDFIGEIENVLVDSIFLGIFIGLIIYMYNNTTKISILTLKYIIIGFLAYIVNDNMWVLPSFVKLEFEHTYSIFSLGNGLGQNECGVMIYVVIAILLVLVKIIQNRITMQKLNKLISK